MNSEFMEAYETIMKRAYVRLRRALKIKVDAIKYCRECLQELKEDLKDMQDPNTPLNQQADGTPSFRGSNKHLGYSNK